jgi:cysteinyl-tRNA synthetase
MADRSGTRNRPALRLENTLTGKRETFKPRRSGRVKIFTCGPSIYRTPHIGNYRTFLYEDILHRYVEYCGYELERVINFTDVEDKAIEECRKKGITMRELTEPIAQKFFEDAHTLRIHLPEFIPRASTSVAQAVKLIRKLMKKGYAYRYDGDVFFDPTRFKGFGKLYGLDMSKWPEKRRRFRKDTYPGQRWNRGDFILWHAARDGEHPDFTWDTELGRGRPAWNIQDAAMITKHLGHTIDISCGGVDNLYRHHDYNIAIIEAVSGRKFANYWLHGEHVLVGGRKMSKSRGNTLFTDSLKNRGFTGEQIRFFLIDKHYRSKLDITPAALDSAAERLNALRKLCRKLTRGRFPETSSAETRENIEKIKKDFEQHMGNDLDVESTLESLERNLAQLQKLRHDKRFNRSDADSLKDKLDDVDAVLQVLF